MPFAKTMFKAFTSKKPTSEYVPLLETTLTEFEELREIGQTLLRDAEQAKTESQRSEWERRYDLWDPHAWQMRAVRDRLGGHTPKEKALRKLHYGFTELLSVRAGHLDHQLDTVVAAWKQNERGISLATKAADRAQADVVRAKRLCLDQLEKLQEERPDLRGALRIPDRVMNT